MKTRARRMTMAVLAVVALVFAASSLIYSQPKVEKTAEMAGPAVPVAAVAQTTRVPGSIGDIQYSFRDVARKVIPQVVELDVTEVVQQPIARMQSPFGYFFSTPDGSGNGQTRDVPQEGLGSGIIVKKSGNQYFLLTNNHVAGSATTITVRLSDNREFKGSLVGKDTRRDIALVSFESSDNLPVAELGDSDALEVGDLVLAVGNPYGFTSTVTMGIVSALGRASPGNQQTYTDYIQTDAAINQGNSGGALVNAKGQVIGINSWIAAPTGGNVGLGFAIPINSAKQAIDQFINKGEVEYGWLGVSIGDAPQESELPGVAKDLKIENMRGAMVMSVFRGSPADKAGLLPGDLVTAVGGQAVKDSKQLTMTVGSTPAGRTLSFELVRYGEKKTLQVMISARDSNDQVAASRNLWPGLLVLRVTDGFKKSHEVPSGVNGLIIGAVYDDTPAAAAGLKPFDMVKQVNGRDVKTVMDVYRAVNETGKTTFTVLRVDNSGESHEVTIGLPQ
jgi:Do/DeqQ family serine protease